MMRCCDGRVLSAAASSSWARTGIERISENGYRYIRRPVHCRVLVSFSPSPLTLTLALTPTLTHHHGRRRHSPSHSHSHPGSLSRFTTTNPQQCPTPPWTLSATPLSRVTHDDHCDQHGSSADQLPCTRRTGAATASVTSTTSSKLLLICKRSAASLPAPSSIDSKTSSTARAGACASRRIHHQQRLVHSGPCGSWPPWSRPSSL